MPELTRRRSTDAKMPTSPREQPVKFAADRPFADPEKAARQLVALANAVEADRDQRIAIELINAPFLALGASADEYRAGIDRAIERMAGWTGTNPELL